MFHVLCFMFYVLCFMSSGFRFLVLGLSIREGMKVLDVGRLREHRHPLALALFRLLLVEEEGGILLLLLYYSPA